MKLNALDLGGRHPWQHPVSGQLVGSLEVEGSEPTVYPRGSVVRKQTVSFWVRAWQGIGGAAALSSTSLRYLLRQVEELASNRDQHPVYVQWSASDDPAALVNASEAHDGWYLIEDFEPDYEQFVMGAEVLCRMTATFVAPPAPRSMAMAYAGGALASNFSGVAKNLLGFPVGSTPAETSGSRAGGEGSIPTVLSPAALSEPVVLSATIANAFKGGVHVYDTLNTGTNPVPTNGPFVHANWVEVFGLDHAFIGDCVITNGLHLYILVVGAASKIFFAYVWNTALATPAWQPVPLFWGVSYANNGGLRGTVQQYTLLRVGAEECAIGVLSTTTDGQAALHAIRLPRGQFACRIVFRPLTQNNTELQALSLNPSNSNGLMYTDSKLFDPRLAVDQTLTGNLDPNFGYTANFDPSSARSIIFGLLWQNQPVDQMYWQANYGLCSGDSAVPVQNAERLYGFFAIPYGVPGHTVDHLQANANGGTLGTGWSSVVDANAQNGNAAKAASGTLVGNADTFGSSFIPRVALYDLWVRARVTSAAGGAAEMTLGFWINGTTLVASANFAANQFATGYTWVRVAVNFNPNSFSNTYQFRAVTNGTLGTDWFIDEMVMVPKSMSEGGNDLHGPQDIYQQWAFDRDVEMIVL